MSLLYIEKIPAATQPSFTQKVQSVSAYLGINPDWLMQVMKAESGLKSTAQNWQGTGSARHLIAAGLLQFTKASGIVAKGIVPSLQHILTMDALAQLDLVKWYFSPYRGRLKSYYDVYAVTFFPAMIGKPDSWVLQTKGLSAGKVASQNKGISKGKGHITVADFKRYAIGLVPKNLRDRILGKAKEVIHLMEEDADQVKNIIATHPEESAGIGAGALIALGFLGWYIFKKA